MNWWAKWENVGIFLLLHGLNKSSHNTKRGPSSLNCRNMPFCTCNVQNSRKPPIAFICSVMDRERQWFLHKNKVKVWSPNTIFIFRKHHQPVRFRVWKIKTVNLRSQSLHQTISCACSTMAGGNRFVLGF